MSSSIFILFLLLSLFTVCYKSDKCAKSDLEFQYTECDKTGRRWLISVPKPNKSCEAKWDYYLPKLARNCGEPCDPGTYLDLESQSCQDCPGGTYSQGDTIEINNWSTLPPGFQTLSFDNNGRLCEHENWTPKVDYISASVIQCQSMLSFTASLYKAGHLKFDYQSSEVGTLFAVKIRHDECLSSSNDKSNIKTVNFMDQTPASSWITKIVSLKQGRNVITWTVSGAESDRSTVKINNVRVTNSIFSSQCMNCSAGYFSSKKSSICSPCQLNKYSDRSGSDQCKDCLPEEYALPGSKSCKPKESCTIHDYSYKWTECDKQKQRKKSYLWIEPKVCTELGKDAVALPLDSQSVTCEPCPRGTFLNDSVQQCQFCPAGSMALNAGDQCSKCSPNTKPISTILYDKWSHPLPNLTFFCVKGFSSQCKGDDLWILNGDHLQSSMISDIHFMELDFQTNDDSYGTNVAGQSLFSFEFGMSCSEYCILQLYLEKDKFAPTRLNTWVNTTSRRLARHHIPPNTSGKYIWFFTHFSDENIAQKSTDHLKIYSIEISNVKNVGAIDCRNCDPKSLHNGCLECDKGKYFSEKSQQCEFCPEGQILKNYPSQSIGDCVSCDSGLSSVDGITCIPSMTFTSQWNSFYDLRKLQGNHLLRGNRLFNTHGQEYVHVFNVTLFGEHGQSFSICRNNITSDRGIVEVKTPICRITIVADKSENNTLYSIQAISLGETFSNIQQSNNSDNYWKQINDSLIKHGFSGDVTGVDIHVNVTSDRKTDICTKGRTTIVTIRCDKTLSKTQFMMPPKCPVETCDGCNFHFLLMSSDACPYCRPEDFTVITEECSSGQKKRHYQTPRYCVLQPGSESTENIKCPLVTMRTAVIVIPTILLLVFLISLVVYCHKKNKRLEYKYMRLISGNDDNEHILTGAESCGMNDGDEDEDEEVKIKTNSKSGKMFARFNKPTRNRKDYNDMETINLNDNPEFDI